MSARAYLDHAATTPLRPEAAAAVADGLARWANPSSPHAEGRCARAALENARARIAGALGWDGQIILTSGASEALALALRGRRVLAGATEHDAVWRAAPGAEVLPVDGDGLCPVTSSVRPEPVEGLPLSFQSDKECSASTGSARAERVEVVALQAANSETGVLHPLAELAPAIRAAGALLLADASQTAGKLPLPEADLIVVSAHKLGGPPGIGALLVHDLAMLAPTGGQEFGYRAGTENLPGALGFAVALEADRGWLADAARWRTMIEAAVRAEGGEVIAHAAPRVDHILALRMPGVAAAAQLIRFDLAGIAISAGSACASGSLKPSRVLAAMGLAPAVTAETIRVSTGWSTSDDDVVRFLGAWVEIARGARRNAA